MVDLSLAAQFFVVVPDLLDLLKNGSARPNFSHINTAETLGTSAP
jgi:hypothetical protein